MFRASNTNPRKKSVVSKKKHNNPINRKKKKKKKKKKPYLQEQNQIFKKKSNFKQAHFLPTHTEKLIQKPIPNGRRAFRLGGRRLVGGDLGNGSERNGSDREIEVVCSGLRRTVLVGALGGARTVYGRWRK
jgi:hypothetical protein